MQATPVMCEDNEQCESGTPLCTARIISSIQARLLANVTHVRQISNETERVLNKSEKILKKKKKNFQARVVVKAIQRAINEGRLQKQICNYRLFF